MRIYHTCASRADVKRAREHAPSFEHGYGWLPKKMCRHPGPWFLDNGAYSAATTDGERWAPDAFLERLRDVDDMPRPPEFVVLPDVPGDHAATVRRTEKHYLDVAEFGYPLYLAVHPGAQVHRVLSLADKCDCAGLLLGGPESWKRAVGDELVARADDADLSVHVGNPPSLVWADDAGVDSVDTSSVVRNGAWHRLDALERASETRQSRLGEIAV